MCVCVCVESERERWKKRSPKPRQLLKVQENRDELGKDTKEAEWEK